MSHKQWEPLTTAEAVIEAIKAGRHVEVRRTISPIWGKTTYVFGPLYFDWSVKNYGAEYRALIAPEQPAADDLRGGAVEPARDISDAAQNIAERVPLPKAIYAEDGSGAKPVNWYAEDQVIALRLAVAAEAVRGAEAARLVPTIEMQNAGWAELESKGVDPELVEIAPVFEAMMRKAPPAATGEVTGAMVERLRKIIRERWGLYLGPDCARAALTAALQEPEA